MLLPKVVAYRAELFWWHRNTIISRPLGGGIPGFQKLVQDEWNLLFSRTVSSTERSPNSNSVIRVVHSWNCLISYTLVTVMVIPFSLQGIQTDHAWGPFELQSFQLQSAYFLAFKLLYYCGFWFPWSWPTCRALDRWKPPRMAASWHDQPNSCRNDARFILEKYGKILWLSWIDIHGPRLPPNLEPPEECTFSQHVAGREVSEIPVPWMPSVSVYAHVWVKLSSARTLLYVRTQEQAEAIYQSGMLFLRTHILLTTLSGRQGHSWKLVIMS